MRFGTKNKVKSFGYLSHLGKIIDERDDPLGLENFFPCPKPLYSTIDYKIALEPIPDFVIYLKTKQEN